MKTLKITTLVLTLFCFILGCSSDESSPELKTESFIVKPYAFYGLFIAQTEGEKLEVYGTISAKIIFKDGSIKEERILWQRDRDSFVAVGRREDVLINSEENDLLFRLTEDEIQSKEALLEIVFSMWDYDPDGNDDFIGENGAPILLKRHFNDEENLVEVNPFVKDRNGVLIVRFKIERIL